MTSPLIRPFEGYVPRSDLVEDVVAPPVSSITTARYQQLVDGNPHSILHLLGSAIDTGEGGTDPSLYDMRGAARLRSMIDEGILVRQPRAFYILSIETTDATHLGIVCEINAGGVGDGRVRRHENTRSETEDVVARHLEIVGAHTDPVAMTYRSQPLLEALIRETAATAEPLIQFRADDGSEQRLWAVSDPQQLTELETLTSAIPAIYITDGHHRTAAAARLQERRAAANPSHTGEEPYNYLLTVLFAEKELALHGFNRAVMDLGGHDAATVLELISERMDVEELAVAYAEEARPLARGVVSMLLEGRWYRIAFRKQDIPDDPRGSLDAVLLQELILGPVLGIHDARADRRLHYIPGPAGLAELEHHEAAIAFALHAASVQDVMAVADQGGVMPPKSTWFSPKVKTGLVVRLV